MTAGTSTVKVTATVGGVPYTDEINIVVGAVAVQSVEIKDADGNEITEPIALVTDETETVQAVVTPTDATNQNVTWASTNEDVATVVNGVITAKGAGTAQIVATTVDGSFTDSVEVEVTAKVAGIEIDGDTKTIVIDETITLNTTTIFI